jgi:ABC-2 type transport system permease protein
MNPRRIGADFKVFSLGYIRNPIALFFALIFPVVLILLFGLIFNGGSTGSTTLYTQNLDPGSPVSEQYLSELNATQVVKIQIVDPGNQPLATYLAQQGYTVGLLIPADFGSNYAAGRPVNVTLYTDPGDAASSGLATGAVTAVTNAFNLAANNATAIVGVTQNQIGSQVFTYVDYLVPGLIGFAILTSPMFSMVDISSNYKKEHLFRQLSLTPLSKSEWLASKIVWFVGLTLVAAVVMVVSADLLFHTGVPLPITALPFLVLGPFMFVSLGMLAGSVAKTPESAALIGNLVTFPMMFLSGTFFPVSGFSPALQVVAHIFPLFYIIDGLNQVMLFGNLQRALVDLVIVLAFAIIFYVAAVAAFRWRES